MAYGERLVINCTTGEETREDVLVNPEQRTASQIATEAYIAARKADYKSLEEQLDMRYWDSVNSTTLWVDHIAKVKSDNPKG